MSIRTCCIFCNDPAESVALETEGDRYFPIPENEKNIPAIWAEHVLDIPVNPDGINILEGLCFDREGNLFICNTPQSRIWKLNPKTNELSVFVDLPDHMMPSAVKIHKDGRIFATMAGSDEGCLVAILSPKGELQEKIITGTGKMIDDMVFDDQGGFYFTDLAGTKADRSAGVFYVEPDYKTVHPVINDGMIATNGIVLDPSGRNLWVTEYGTALLHRFTLAEDRHTIEPAFSYTAYHFTGLEGPDSMHIDEDGNLYIAICGQARFMVFNANGFPIGQILLPGRKKGEMEKSTHLAIRPGTNEAYMCSADLKRNVCSIFRARVFAKAYRSYQFQ